MATRLIDVLSDDEKVLDRRITAAKELLASVNMRVGDARSEHEKVCGHIERDKKAHEALTIELKGLGALKIAHNMAQLTGQDTVKVHRVPSKKNLFDT